MDVAGIIIGTLALILGIINLSIMLAKNFFSTHVIQREMIDPFKDMMPNEVGKNPMDILRELGDPISADEMEHIYNLKNRKPKAP